MMTYYQNADMDVVTPVRRRRYNDMDDDDLYTTAGVFPASRKAMTISNKAMDEGDLRTSASSRKDQQLLSDITAKLADIAQPAVMRAPTRHQTMRPMATRYTRRGMVVYPFTSLPDDVIYSRRVVRASSVPPSPVLSAAELDYTPMTSRRLELYTRAESEPREQIRQRGGYYPGRRPASYYEYPGDDAMMHYSPSYYSGPATYAGPRDLPSNSVYRRQRYSYRETSPVHEASPSCTLNHLRNRATNARNKLDHHRTLLDRYLPEPMGDAQDVQSAVLYKYGELVERAKHIGRKCQTLGRDYEKSYAARREIPSTMPTSAFYDYYYY